jgi:HSP20 family molecular chaperone IbpA
MFNKKCPKCNKKIKKSSNFCPICGYNFFKEESSEDYGLIGKEDEIMGLDSLAMGNPFMEKMFTSALKILEKQMKELNKESNISNLDTTKPGVDIQFYVNGKRVSPNIVPIKKRENITSEVIKQKTEISEEKRAMFKELPKKEPKSTIRRLGNKIVYELSVPGVDNIEDVLINKLENSIEIKALSKKTVYSKIININLPISKYALDNGNLILELKEK